MSARGTTFAVVAIALASTGCGHWGAVKGHQEVFFSGASVEADFPSGWHFPQTSPSWGAPERVPTVKGKPWVYLITREGFSLQRLTVSRYDLEEVLPGAEKSRDPLMAAAQVLSLTMDGATPETISGVPGFRSNGTEVDEAGLRRRIAVAAAIRGTSLFVFKYEAPDRVYFARDLAAFEQLYRSAKISD